MRAVFLMIGLSMVSFTGRADMKCKVESSSFQKERDQMVKLQIEKRGVKDEAVLNAMRCVPRHSFVSKEMEKLAHTDGPLPIGDKQTISQPYIVAFMTEAAKLKPTDRVFEVGTGSGYQAAVLAEIVKEVYSVEIVPHLAEAAESRLKSLGYKNIHVKKGDGYEGMKEKAPFDVIFVTAAPDHIPEPLIEQLKVGGRFIIPVGESRQHLIRLTKTKEGLKEESLLPVVFVPMTGIAGQKQLKPQDQDAKVK